MKHTIIYARVSSDEQAREGKTSLQTQITACQDYARKNELEIVETITDDFTGTVPPELRPGGQRAFALLSSGQAEALIAYRMDRIVRPPEEGDEWDIPVLIRGLARLGREIHVVNRGRIGVTFSDLLLAMLDAKSAGDERRSFLSRVKLGHLAKAKSGRVPGKGRRLFGYHYKDGAFVIDESEATLVRQIFDMYINGLNGRKMSLKAIANYLTRKRQPTLSDLYGITRPKHRRGMWHINTVRRMLTHPAYKGEWQYHDSESGETVTVPVPAIVNAHDWQRAQVRLKLNGEYAFRNSKPGRYLLRGMIRCRTCHRVFIGKTKGKGILYYGPNCADGPEGCPAHERMARAEVLEEIAWDYVLHIVLGDDLEAILSDLASHSQRAEQERETEVERILSEISEAETEAARLADAVERVGGAVGAALQRKIAEVNGRHAELITQRDEAMSRKPALAEDDLAAYLDLRRRLAEGIQNATPLVKRRKFEEIELSITVRGGRATVASIFPTTFEDVELHRDAGNKSQTV